LKISHYRSLGDQSKPDEFQQVSTKDGRKSAIKFVNIFHLNTGRPSSDNRDAFVTCSDLKDEKWLEAFSKWLSTARKVRDPDEYLSAGSCTQYFPHVKENYKKAFPNAPLFST
jgi:hypothetical protein